MLKKTVTVLGSTGSVGVQTLDSVRNLGFRVNALTGYANARLLETQCREFAPQTVWASESAYKELKILLADTDISVITGADALEELAYSTKCDIICNSISGVNGLKPTLAAIEGGHDIALSNKEALVEGGSIVMKRAAEKGVKLIPVDSEHSAIFQCLGGRTPKKILLTASGGSFFGKKRDFLEKVTPEAALHHPNWSMGQKITVDSSTMMNKGLEIIEAVWLFGVKPADIEVIIHRESIIHSMVEFPDNAVIAQLAKPDMRLCCQYALTYPERMPSLTGELDFAAVASLSFAKPDEDTFTLLKLAKRAIKTGGNIPASMSSANEVAVALFLDGKIGFTDIFDIVERAVDETAFIAEPTVDDIMSTDTYAGELVHKYAEA